MSAIPFSSDIKKNKNWEWKTEMAKDNGLGTGNVRSLVLRLAIPAMIAQLVNVLYGIVDRIFIGNIPEIGGTALAGAGVCAPIVTLITSFATLVGMGGAPILAMRMGEKNQKGAEKILSNCFMLLFFISIVITVIVLIFKKPMLMVFGASVHTLPYADTYLTLYCLGTVFAILSLGLNYFIVCQGFSTAGMFTVLIGAALNIILDPILIFVFDMGVAGAAIATVISQMVSAMFVISFLLSKKTPVRIHFGNYSLEVIKKVLYFGASPFFIIASDSVLIIVLNAVLQKYGGAARGDILISCNTIVQSFLLLVTMPLGGITGGTQGLISFNYGAKNTSRIKEAEKYIMISAIIFVCFMFFVSRMAAEPFVRIFTQNEEYIKISVWGIQMVTLGILPLACQYSIVDCLTALGIAPVAITLCLIRKSTFFLGTVLFPIYFGAESAFFAVPTADVFSAIISIAVFSTLFKRLLKRREEMPEGQTLYG